MSTPSEALFISIPTTIFSFCSFWAALYISVSCWLMKKLHDRRFQATNTGQQNIKHIKHLKLSISNNYEAHNYSLKMASRTSLDYSFTGPTTAPNTPKATDPISGSSFMFNGYNTRHSQSLRTHSKRYSTTSDQFVSAYVDEHNIDSSWERPQLIMHHIFYMSLCDALLSFWVFLNYVPQIFLGSTAPLFLLAKQSNAICYISSIILQFALCGTVIWYFIVGCNLFRIVFGLNNTNFDKIKRNDSIFAWCTIILCTIIPMFTNNYGEINNLSTNDYPFKDKHCWINNEIYRLCLYIPVLITILFAVFILFSVILKWYKDNETDRCRLCNICCLKTDYIFGGISLSDSAIVSRLTAFSLVFICVWITPSVNELIQISTQNQTKIGLVAASQWSIALIGSANCFIWSRSKNFRSFITSYHDIVECRGNKQNSILDKYNNELDI